MLDNKRKKTVMLFLGATLIVTLCYVEKTKLISQYGVIFHEMGVRCKDRCRQDRQLEYFLKAARHNPNLSAAHYQLALIYDKRGNYSKALESFQRVTQLDHENLFAFYKVGVHYFKEGAYEHALRCLLQSTYSGTGYPCDTPYYIAQIYDRNEEYNLASNYYYASVLECPEYESESLLRFAEITHLLGKDEVIPERLNAIRNEIHRYDLADQLERSFKAIQASGLDRLE